MTNTVHHGDCLTVLKTFPDEFIDCCVTSPPYWGLRDYGIEGQLGLEPTFHEYLDRLIAIFDEVKRVLRKDGTCWVVLGDTYSGGVNNNDSKKVYGAKTLKPIKAVGFQCKSLLQIPSRFAIMMTDHGWILRNEIIWYKPNAMPSSVKDRFTVDFEKVFFFVKNKKYWFEQQLEKSIWFEKDKRAITGGITKSGKSITSEGNQYQINKSGSFRKDGNRNKRCVWQIPTKPFKEAHFAVFPPTLVEPMIQAGCPENGIVLDPFIGSGTVAQVATLHRRNWIGIELNPEYIKLADKRRQVTPRLL